MSSRDWFEIDLSASEQFQGKFDDVIFSARYVCRHDGMIIFNVRVLEADLRLLVSIAAKIVFKIKEECGHTHVYDTSNWAEDVDLTSYPVLSENKAFQSLAEMSEFWSTDERMRELRAVSPSTGEIIEQSAVLTIKKLYSRLYDRVSERVAEYDFRITAFNFSIFTPKAIAWMIYLLFLIIAAAFVLILFRGDLGLDLHKILEGTLFLVVATFALTHVKQNLNYNMGRKIKLYRKLIAYYSHGNNLSRVLRMVFTEKPPPVSDDFDPIISIANDEISASTRRVTSYTFMFSALVSVIGIFFSIIG